MAKCLVASISPCLLQEDVKAARPVRVDDGQPDDSTHQPSNTPKSNKTARAYAKTYKLGPPLVPAIILSRLLDYTSRLKLTNKKPFIYAVCKYWSLKREARRGAPLLKRLHLEVRALPTVRGVMVLTTQNLALDCLISEQAANG